MRRNDAEQIGEMIRKFFRQNALEAPLNEYRLIQAWKDVVGSAITKYTSNLYIKNQILYVHITSSVLRQELMMGRDLLVKNLNKQVGAQVIVNILYVLLVISEGSCKTSCQVRIFTDFPSSFS